MIEFDNARRRLVGAAGAGLLLAGANSKLAQAAGKREEKKAYWAYLLATALFNLGNSSNSFLILRTQDFGVSLETTILIYAGFNLIAALISYPAGALSDRFGRKNVLLASFVIFGVGYLGFAFGAEFRGHVAIGKNSAADDAVLAHQVFDCADFLFF